MVAVLAALVAALLPAAPARASHQYLWWNADGATFARFGANADIRIYQGAVEYDCDWVYPTADIYVVPAGDTAVGTLLHDRSGVPNTVQGASGGLFIEETIGFTAPSGKVGTGRYAVVYDECQDGKVDAGDFVLDPAFSVEIPADVPPLDSRITALKEQAGKDAASWQRLTDVLDGIDALQKVKATIECLQGIGSCVAQYLLDSLKDKIISEGMVWLGVQDPKDGARKEVDNLIKHYAGIHADPPDPAFRQATPLEAVTPLEPRTAERLTNAEVALGNAAATQARVAEALLHSLERYQGADLEHDGTWALNHARAIRDYAADLEAQLAATDALLRDVQSAFQSDTTDFDSAAAALEPLRQRIAADGFTADEQRELANLDQSDADAAALRAFIAARDYSQASEAGLQQALQTILDGNVDGATVLATLQSDMDAIVAHLEADPGVTAHTPVASAGGPYTATEGAAVTLDARASSDADGTIASYEWDLDRDGAFDDATGPQPTFTFPSAFDGLVGVRVTDDDALSAIVYARISVADVNRPPTLEVMPADPQLSVQTGSAQPFSATVSDPDGDAVSVRWRVNGDVAREGTSFSYTPNFVGQFVVSAEASDGQPGGGSVVEARAVAVRAPDTDADGWTATTDCDDTDASVHPGATEVAGNGKDDDCDPATSDAGSPPRPAFVPHGSGGNVAFRDHGARIVASSGTPYGGHTAEEMLDFRVDDMPWASGPPNTSPYAVVELSGGQPYVIDRVQVRPRPSYADQRVADFAVDVSDTTADPSAFTTVLTARTSNSSELQTFALPAPTTARYVRYRPLSSHGGAGTCGGNCISTQQFRVLTTQHGGATVAFTNTSTPADTPILSYLWDFGDGTTSTEADPTHTFPAPGRYTVTLTATDEDGQSASTALEQQVHAFAAPDFTTSPADPLEGGTVTFTDRTVPAAGTTIVGRTWDWGDYTPSSTSGSHVYQDDGTFDATLEVLDSAGHVATVTRPVTVTNVAPVVQVGPDRGWVAGTALRLRRGAELTVRDVPGDVLTCRWDFGDGTSSNSCDLDHAYDYTADWGTDAPAKTFTATLTVTDDDGAVSTDSLDIAVRPLLVPSPANLVRNGDFERPEAGTWFTFHGAGANLDGWLVEPQSVELISTYFADAATSEQSIDLSGSARGAISQQIATTPGQRYRLRFAVAGNIEGPHGVRRADVHWGGTSLGVVEFDTTGRSRRNMGWRYEERTVTATDTTTTLRFASLTDGVFGLFLDDVSLLPIGPETTALFNPKGRGANVASAERGAGITSASSTYSASYPATTLIDNDPTNSYWATANGQTSGSVVVELAPGPWVVDRVRIRPAAHSTERVRDFAIDVSTTTAEAAAFTTVLTATAADNAELQEFALERAVVGARYVRYRALNNRGSSCCVGTAQFQLVSGQFGAPTVAFENLSTLAQPAGASFMWDFGDGATSTQTHPTHTFPAPGTYDVTLAATDGDGATATLTLPQTVVAPPVAAFSHAPRVGAPGRALTFTDASSGAGAIVGWAWDFGDGTASAQRNPSKTYTAPGTYDVRLAVTDEYGQTATTTTTVEVRTGYVTLATAPGDGQLVIDVAGYGDFGYQLLPESVAPAGRGDAVYDPVGPAAPGSTSWESALHLRRPGVLNSYLSSGLVGQISPQGGLQNPGITKTSPTTAVSRFAAAGLDVELEQEVSDLVKDGARNGSVLTQTYRITNTLETVADFEVVRYYEGDLKFGFGAGVPDGGGRLVSGGQEFVFQTDKAGTPATDVDFVGITSEGGEAPSAGRYEVGQWTGFPERIRQGLPLADAVHGDGADEDQFVDAGNDYDVGIALANRFAALAPGEAAVYVTKTYFGSGPPQALANTAPEIAPIDNVTLDEGGQRTVDVAASDADGDAVALSGEGLPAFATFVDNGDGTATVQLAPGFSDAGAYEVTVVADDGEASAAQTFTVTVVDVPPPVAEDQDVRTDEDTTAGVLLRASGDPQRFDVVDPPAHGRLSGNAPDLLYIPDPDFHGSDAFTYTASNAAGTSAPATVTITVAPVNDAPVADAGGPYATDEGSPVALSASASDVDGDTLDYAWDLDGDGAFDDASGPQPSVRFDDDGEHVAVVRVSDAGGLSDDARAVVTVSNVAPLIQRFSAGVPLAGAAAFGTAFAAEFTDPGAADTHEATFTFADATRHVAPYTSGQEITHEFGGAGCDLRVAVEVRDDDGGADHAETRVDVGAGAFLPPLRQDRQPHATTSGQVVPVKVRITDCHGTERNDLSPAIRVREGDGVTDGGSMQGPETAPETRAASETRGVMRRNGNHYHYTLHADLAPGRWTVLVYPFGTDGPSLRHLLDVSR